jgi:antitoxin MazE
MANASVQKWGNSLAVRIPKPLAEQVGVAEGTEVDVVARQGQIIIRPAKPRYSLDELLSGITPHNRHAETDFGPPTGNESW